MTLAEATERARRLSRTSASGASDTVVMGRINDAMNEFAKNVHGLVREGYLTLTPRFDLETNFAIRVTITGGTNAMTATDVAVCSAEAFDQTGTQVATALQATLRTAIGAGANLTVTWSTTTWKFTVDAIDSTAIVIESPDGITYADATGLLGLDDSGTTSIIGSIPVAATAEVTLPTDYLGMVGEPTWDDTVLYRAPHDLFNSPLSIGTPQCYSIRGDRMRFSPSPSEQGICRIQYKYKPTAFTTVQGYQECGLTSKTNATATGLSASTQYYWKVSVDGAAIVEYSITTGADVTFAGVIALLNAALTTVTWAIVGGDLRCTSNTQGSSSSISLSAGTTGTNLFATLTGFTALDTTVSVDSSTDLPIDDRWNEAIVYKAAHDLAEESFEYTTADRLFSQFKRICGEFVVHRANQNTDIFPTHTPPPLPRVNYD